MAGINKVILIGHLGKDPEIRNTQAGQQVANLRLATSEQWKDKAGERQERTEWHTVVVWGPLADVLGKYAMKGSRIYVEGKLATRKWVDSSGAERYTTEVVVQGFGGTIQLLDKSERSGGGERPRNDDERESRPQRLATAGGLETRGRPNRAEPERDEWDDIPF